MVGWLTSMPADRSHTQDSPPVWLATTLSRRSRTGSEIAFSFAASSVAAAIDSGSRASGANSQDDTFVNGSDFDTHQY